MDSICLNSNSNRLWVLLSGEPPETELGKRIVEHAKRNTQQLRTALPNVGRVDFRVSRDLSDLQLSLESIAAVKNAGVVVVSPRLDDAHQDCSKLLGILKGVAVQHKLPACTVALAQRHTVDELGGIDFVCNSNPPDPQEVSTALESSFNRLSNKLPPLDSSLHAGATQYEITGIQSHDDLLGALRLRARSYRDLGYIDARNFNDDSLEVDGYDQNSLHFVIKDGDRVAAYVRLIVPGLDLSLPGRDPGNCQRRTQNHVRELLDSSAQVLPVSARVRDPMNSLPVFDSFGHFIGLDVPSPRRGNFEPVRSCEVSRLIVDEAYRGRHLSSRLIQHIEAAAKRLKRRYIFLECAPFHEAMFAAYGYKAVRMRGDIYYQRPQRLDTWALAQVKKIN